MKFEKYQGTGNDFILLDDRSETFPVDIELIQKLCDRKFGIGSDGLMLLRNTDVDFEMIFFNPDGSKSLCGNGSRCAVAHASKIGLASGSGVFRTTDGLHKYELTRDVVSIAMHPIKEIATALTHQFVDTGSPHLIVEVAGLNEQDILEKARPIRYHDQFVEIGGTNVNFITYNSDSSVSVRTYERGVEDETLSCGTGVTAVALASAGKKLPQPIKVRTKGGDLTVSYKTAANGFEDIWLAGPATHVYSGQIDIDDFIIQV